MLRKPQYIFAFISLVTGIILAFLIPPIGNIDENQHIRRVSEISEFILFNPVTATDDKLTHWADNAFIIRRDYYNENRAWNFSEVKNISSEEGGEKNLKLEKNVLLLNSPLIYVPYAAVLKIAKNIYPDSYWLQFYILRLAAVIFTTALLTLAIARAPRNKTLLAAICLLPVMVYTRSGINIDGIAIGCIFLFIIEIFNLCQKERIGWRQVAVIALLGFLVAQCKGAYVPLLFLAFLLPRHAFALPKQYWLAMAVIIIPAAVCGLGWSNFAREEVLTGIRYVTNNVNEVWPDGQYARITANPLEFVVVLLRTIFTTIFIPQSVLEMVGFSQWNGFALHVAPLLAVIMLLVAIAATEPVENVLSFGIWKKQLLLLSCGAAFGLMLMMLYVQWSGYMAPVVSGFQGRYIYPLLPVLLVFIKPAKELASHKRATNLLWVFGFVSSAGTIWQVWADNYI